MVLGLVLLIAVASCRPQLTENITASKNAEGMSARQPRGSELTITADVSIQADAIKQPLLSIFEIAPSFVWVSPGEEVRLVTKAFDQYNQPFDDFELSWGLGERMAGTVDVDGMFTAGPKGGYFSQALLATAIQTVDGAEIKLTADMAVLVEQAQEIAELDSIQVVPGDIDVSQGQLLRLMAFGIGDSGLIIPGVLFEWVVIDPSLGTLVDEDTVKILASEGEYRNALSVTGYHGGKEITLSLSVSVKDSFASEDLMTLQIIPGFAHVTVEGTYNFEAIALGKNGRRLKDVGMSWEVSSSVGQFVKDGIFKAGSTPGVYTDAIKVTAKRVDGMENLSSYAHSTVIIEPVVNQVLSGISLLPSSSVIAPGKPVQFRVYAFDEEGRLIPGATVTWGVSEEAVGVISDYGRLTAHGPAGHYSEAITVTVSHSGQRLSASADITITGPLSKAVIWPNDVEVAPGDVVLFKASGVDENNVELSSLVVDFRLKDPNAGSITPFGYFVASDTDGYYPGTVEARVVELTR